MTGTLLAAVAAGAAVITAGAALPRPRWYIAERILRRHPRLAPLEIRTAEWSERTVRHIRSGSSLTHAVVLAAEAVDTTNGHAHGEAVNADRARTRPGVGRANTTRPTTASLPSPLRALADDLKRGVALGAAVDRQTPCGIPALDLAMAAVATCAAIGGPAAPTLERVATTLRTRAALADEIATQSAQARLSALVLTLVPIALLIVLVCADSNVRLQLQRPIGITTIVGGAAFNLAGWLWIRHLTRRPS